jgi:hypothetical protein
MVSMAMLSVAYMSRKIPINGAVVSNIMLDRYRRMIERRDGHKGCK